MAEGGSKMSILRENKFARDMLTIAAIGAVLAGLFGAEREERERKERTAIQNQQVVIYEVPE
jgi:hypothetical protein